MFEEGDKIFYLNTKDGGIYPAKFQESTTDGAWIRIDGDSVNTFVYSEFCETSLFKEKSQAESGLEGYIKNLENRLLKNNFFISDIRTKLSKTEGKIYAEVIAGILNDLVLKL